MTVEQLRLLGALRHVALRHAAESQDTERALRLTTGMLQMALRHRKPGVDAETRAILESLILAGDLHARQREFDEAIQFYSDANHLIGDHSLTQCQVTDDDGETSERFVPDPMVVYDVKYKLGMLLDARGHDGDEKNALQLLEDALALLDASDEPPEDLVGNLENTLGMLYRNQKDFSIAEAHYLRAHEIFSRTRGADHLSVATLLNNLGSLYWASEDMERARDCHIRALEIRAENLPESHPELGQSSSNLAAVYHLLGEFANASLHYERALKILEQNLGTDAETFEIVTQNYVDLLQSHDHNERAEELLKKMKHLLSPAEEATQPVPRPLLPPKR